MMIFENRIHRARARARVGSMVSMVLFVLVYGYAGPPGVGVVAVRGGRAFMGDGSCMMRPCVRIDGGIYTFAARVARGRRLVTCRRADARARERHFDAPTHGDDRSFDDDERLDVIHRSTR